MSVHTNWESLVNRPVEIQCSDGSVHYGVVASFDQDTVYLEPLPNEQLSTGEPQRGNDERFFGFGPQAFWGGFAGSLLGIGLGSIIAVRPYYASYGQPGPYYGPRPPYYGGSYGPGPGPFFY